MFLKFISWFLTVTFWTITSFFVIEDLVHYLMAQIFYLILPSYEYYYIAYDTGKYFIPLRISYGLHESFLSLMVSLFLSKTLAAIFVFKLWKDNRWDRERNRGDIDMKKISWLFLILLFMCFNFTFIYFQPVVSLYRYGLLEGFEMFQNIILTH